MIADDLIAILAAPLTTPAAAMARPAAEGTLPMEHGIYAWWVSAGRLPGISGPRHASEPMDLLQVGAAPPRAGLTAGLRQTVGHHLGTNISASGFRAALAALLHEQEGWTPGSAGGRPRLTLADDRRLREWQEEHLRLAWTVRPQPWQAERALIHSLSPPLNLAEREGTAFAARLHEASAALEAKAAASVRPRLPYQPADGAFVVGYDIDAMPITRNRATRRRRAAAEWLAAISRAAGAAAASVRWSAGWRFAAVVEIRIPWDADIDNFLKDTLDRSTGAGVFAGDDRRVDLVHGIKRAGVPAREAGARVEVWRLRDPENPPRRSHRASTSGSAA